MRINKILAAFGNLGQIAQGIKNNIFKQDDIEEIAKMRWLECKVCPLLDREGKSCAGGVSQKPCCSDCGCGLKYKLRALSSSCPKGRWNKVMDRKLEKKLIIQIDQQNKVEHDKKMKALKEKNAEFLKQQKLSNGSNI